MGVRVAQAPIFVQNSTRQSLSVSGAREENKDYNEKKYW